MKWKLKRWLANSLANIYHYFSGPKWTSIRHGGLYIEKNHFSPWFIATPCRYDVIVWWGVVRRTSDDFFNFFSTLLSRRMDRKSLVIPRQSGKYVRGL
jgi:hypothetical protein